MPIQRGSRLKTSDGSGAGARGPKISTLTDNVTSVEDENEKQEMFREGGDGVERIPAMTLTAKTAKRTLATEQVFIFSLLEVCRYRSFLLCP